MELFNGEPWETLAAAGAAVQRPLWASTGVKNPAYPDTMYVDQLIAPYTVNTMPLATLNAVADHGTVPGATARIDPTAELNALQAVGIDMTAVTEQLLEDGITLFEDGDELAARRHRQEPLGDRHRPPADDRRKPAARVRGAGDDAHQACGLRERRPARLEARPVAVGRPRRP